MKEWGLVHKMKNNFASCNLHTYGTSNQKVFAINFDSDCHSTKQNQI